MKSSCAFQGNWQIVSFIVYGVPFTIFYKRPHFFSSIKLVIILNLQNFIECIILVKSIIVSITFNHVADPFHFDQDLYFLDMFPWKTESEKIPTFFFFPFLLFFHQNYIAPKKVVCFAIHETIILLFYYALNESVIKKINILVIMGDFFCVNCPWFSIFICFLDPNPCLGS